VVSSLEQILLAIDNIHNKCKDKKEWTQHDVDQKEIDKFDNKKKPYLKRVAAAKQKIKHINNYIADYQTIIELYNEKSTEKNK
jgi:hypothetical protein